MAEYAKQQGVTVNKLETMLGASKGVFAKALKADGNTSTQWVENFCSVFSGVSPEWLLFGNGDSESKKECISAPLCGDPASFFYGGGKRDEHDNNVMHGRIEQLEKEIRDLKAENRDLNREVGRLEARVELYEKTQQKNEELIGEVALLKHEASQLRAQLKEESNSVSFGTAR